MAALIGQHKRGRGSIGIGGHHMACRHRPNALSMKPRLDDDRPDRLQRAALPESRVPTANSAP